MGGGTAWEYAAEAGNRLAAFVPICGALPPDSLIAKQIAATDTHIWAFHNTDDNVVSVSYTTRYVNYIKFYNPDFPVKMTIWPTGGHDAWSRSTDPSYQEDGKNIYEWMLQFVRNKN
jgi:predicted peptidase